MLLPLILLIVGLVVIYQRLSEMTTRLNRIESRLRALERGASATPDPQRAMAPPAADPMAPVVDPVTPVVVTEVTIAIASATAFVEVTPTAADAPAAPWEMPPVASPVTPPVEPVPEDLETTIGSRWMLVVGTVVLVLGVAFFVKYAFDNAWINETARILIGTVAGVLMWAGGMRIARAGYPLYGRVVSGGGLAIVYITAFAASALYELVSPAVSFVWMVATSALTLATADRQRSSGLALMAIVLAYAAPLLVGRDGSHLGFFSYNLILACVTLALTLRHGWPVLGFSSLYLAVMTSIAWGFRAFTPDLYVSTELYLVVSLALFMAMLRVHHDGVPAAGLIARGLSLALPVLFHGASVAVLYPHSIALLGYLIVGTAVAVGTPLVRRLALARLALWILVALPFYAWLLQHTNGVWYIPALATSVGLYTLHLLTQLLTMSETARPATAEVVLFHANGLGLFVLLYVAVDANAGSTAVVAAVLAVWNGVLAVVSRKRMAECTAQALALAFALAATSIALAFVGPWVTVGWAAEGAAVIGVGLAMNRPFLRAGGAGLLAVAAARLVVYQLPVTLVGHRPVLNLRVATAAFIIAMFYGVAAFYRRQTSPTTSERRWAINGATAVAHVLTVLLITAEIVSFWESSPDRPAAAFARQLSISLAWAVYALGLIVTGFRRSSSLLRYLALGLFALTVLKMFSIDLLELAGIYRIVGFVALGLMLLGASFLYQRSFSKR